jgi:hypothetical protein
MKWEKLKFFSNTSAADWLGSVAVGHLDISNEEAERIIERLSNQMFWKFHQRELLFIEEDWVKVLVPECPDHFGDLVGEIVNEIVG